MRLTQIVKFYQHRMRVPGLLYDGKKRINPPVTVAMKRKALMDLMREKKNLEILDKPYISKEVSFGHSQAMGKKQRNWEAIKTERAMNMVPHCYYETEIKNSLNARKQWGKQIPVEKISPSIIVCK